MVRKPTLAAASAGFIKTPWLKVWIPSGMPEPQARPHLAVPGAAVLVTINGGSV
jgi:hypothetical protein